MTQKATKTHTLDKHLKTFASSITRGAKKVHQYLGVTGWVVLVFLGIIGILVGYYQSKIRELRYDTPLVYDVRKEMLNDIEEFELPRQHLRMPLRNSLIENFDKHFERQWESIDDLYNRQKGFMDSYWKRLEDEQDLLDTDSGYTKQSYQKQLSTNDKEFSYKFTNENGFFEGVVSSTEEDLSNEILQKLKKLGLSFEEKNDKVSFSGSLDDVNELLETLDF